MRYLSAWRFCLMVALLLGAVSFVGRAEAKPACSALMRANLGTGSVSVLVAADQRWRARFLAHDPGANYPDASSALDQAGINRLICGPDGIGLALRVRILNDYAYWSLQSHREDAASQAVRVLRIVLASAPRRARAWLDLADGLRAEIDREQIDAAGMNVTGATLWLHSANPARIEQAIAAYRRYVALSVHPAKRVIDYLRALPALRAEGAAGWSSYSAITHLQSAPRAAATVLALDPQPVARLSLALDEALLLPHPDRRRIDGLLREVIAGRWYSHQPESYPPMDGVMLQKPQFDGKVDYFTAYMGIVRPSGGLMNFPINCDLAVQHPSLIQGDYRAIGVTMIDTAAPVFFCANPKLHLPKSVYRLINALYGPSGIPAIQGTIISYQDAGFFDSLIPIQYQARSFLPAANGGMANVTDYPFGQMAALTKLGIGPHTLPLQAWGTTDLWTYRRAQQIDADFRRAKYDLVTYDQSVFSMSKSQARLAAFVGIWNLGNEENWAVSGKVNRLALAILEHRPLPVVKAALAREAKIPMTTYFAAVAYPAALRCLLARQNDVDVVNDYGKNLLMEAARYNQLRTVKMLLARGVNVNAKTKVPEGIEYRAMPDDRTALMFAASYAGLPVIKTLLAAGADINARDSIGLSAYDYLEGKAWHHNRNLTENGFVIAEHDLYPTKPWIHPPLPPSPP